MYETCRRRRRPSRSFCEEGEIRSDDEMPTRFRNRRDGRNYGNSTRAAKHPNPQEEEDAVTRNPNRTVSECSSATLSESFLAFMLEPIRNSRLGVTTRMPFLKTQEEIAAYTAQYKNEFVEFDDQIWTFYETNIQDQRTYEWKMDALESIREFAKEVYPHGEIAAVGSTMSGCGTFESDLDLCLCLKKREGGYDEGRIHATSMLRRIAKHFRNTRPAFIKDIGFIGATVPILKFYLNPPFADLDLDLNCNNISGIYNTHLIHHYERIDHRFAPICLLVKRWAINEEIKDALHGSFNSYTLVLMVVHFLQCACSPPVLPNLQHVYEERFNKTVDLNDLELFVDLPFDPIEELNTQSIGELVVGFFAYYSQFDYGNHGISVMRGDIFDRSLLRGPLEHYKIFVEEPFDGYNTARTVTTDENFFNIIIAFRKARNAFLGDEAGVPNIEALGI
ncbi:hypothetical protein L596_028361 [Steinernema carpocapsae]|uniref:Uncharacterized protein n=1 Tax=Steinernema carpocapsae TaxID=34508 RepID=A0A4U5LY92_STECR|nr:hypothetical protein L596_028361 [Steinernema carpocapsae]